MTSILVLHGPNLNLLGRRESEHYGCKTLAEIDALLQKQAQASGNTLECFQSNAEHDLVEMIHTAQKKEVDYIVFNPGAFTHTSIALRDALLAVRIPFIEVHISNIHARESFRRQSFLSDIAQGSITGFGAHSYTLALYAILEGVVPQGLTQQ